MSLVRTLLAALTMSAALALALCGTAPAAPLPPAAVALGDAGWQYAPDPQDQGLAQQWQAGRAPTAWRDVTLPHVFDPQPDPSSFGGTVGWYRLRLTAPSLTPGFGWGVRFAQIRRVSQVFLDGLPLATHIDPYAPFTVPLTALGDGRAHELTVRVDNRKGREPREGWWNWGGITRPASLVPLGQLSVAAPGFLPERRCDAGGDCRWDVLVDADVENRGVTTVEPRLSARLRAPGGEQAGAATVVSRPLAPGERARVQFRVAVRGDARLWSPGDPALYDVALEAADATGVQEVDRARIGLRTVSVEHGLLSLNGKPIELRGASIQEDVAGHGPALTDADVDGIVAQLKAIGANITRAHYALDERLLRKLDEAGIMVWSQAPVYHRDELFKTPEGRAQALATVRATVLAARNHPAVITHSVANELSVIPDQVDGTRRFLDGARRLTLDLDPTLPTSVDTLSYPGYPRQSTYAQFNLLGVNSYFGWYPGKANHSTANVADLEPYLRQMRAWYPGTGLVLTEFGAEATMHGPAAEKETYAFQADYAKTILGIVDRAPWLSGAIWWTLREFAVKPFWDGGALRQGIARDSIHNKGLITYDGREKPAYFVLRDDIKRTSLVRGTHDVELATGIRAPLTQRGTIGAGLAVGILALVALLLAADVWAVLGWRRAVHGEHRDDRRRRAALEAMAARGEAPALRRVA